MSVNFSIEFSHFQKKQFTSHFLMIFKTSTGSKLKAGIGMEWNGRERKGTNRTEQNRTEQNRTE
jgi:hypothetical protein